MMKHGRECKLDGVVNGNSSSTRGEVMTEGADNDSARMSRPEFLYTLD